MNKNKKIIMISLIIIIFSIATGSILALLVNSQTTYKNIVISSKQIENNADSANSEITGSRSCNEPMDIWKF